MEKKEQAIDQTIIQKDLVLKEQISLLIIRPKSILIAIFVCVLIILLSYI